MALEEAKARVEFVKARVEFVPLLRAVSLKLLLRLLVIAISAHRQHYEDTYIVARGHIHSSMRTHI